MTAALAAAKKTLAAEERKKFVFHRAAAMTRTALTRQVNHERERVGEFIAQTNLHT
jgi:hypothetical protein